jgi:hypothetical protein
MWVHTRKHHLIPRCRKGKETIDCCETCESYIHKTWNHNELGDTFNSVKAILADEGFQKFLKWRRKQTADTLFKSDQENIVIKIHIIKINLAFRYALW